MSDKCIIHGCPNHKNQGSFIGDMCAPCSNMLISGEPKFGVTFIHKMRDRIEELETKLSEAEWLLVEATVQLWEGKAKTRRNRADLIDAFLAKIKGEQP